MMRLTYPAAQAMWATAAAVRRTFSLDIINLLVSLGVGLIISVEIYASSTAKKQRPRIHVGPLLSHISLWRDWVLLYARNFSRTKPPYASVSPLQQALIPYPRSATREQSSTRPLE